MLKVRPYLSQDEAGVYEVCRKTCDDGLDGTEIFPAHADLVGDKFVGSYLATHSDFCFVIENASGGVCGYALAATDARDFSKQQDMAWIPAMLEKYPRTDKQDGLSPAEEMIGSFYSHKSYIPDELFARFPSIVRVDLLPECRQDPTAFRRVLAACFMTLRTYGSHGVYTQLHVGDRNNRDQYAGLNFYDVPLTDRPDDVVILGRAV